MSSKSIKSILVAVFSLFLAVFSGIAYGQAGEEKKPEVKEEKLDAGEIILDHVMDAHEFHLLTIKNDENPAGSKHITIPLPVILYSKDKGFSFFMSSAFHHGEEVHEGYRLLTSEYMKEHGLDKMKTAAGDPMYAAGKIYQTDAAGMPLADIGVTDLSLTKNATQMLLMLTILLILLLSIAKKYKNGVGVNNAPKG